MSLCLMSTFNNNQIIHLKDKKAELTKINLFNKLKNNLLSFYCNLL